MNIKTKYEFKEILNIFEANGNHLVTDLQQHNLKK